MANVVLCPSSLIIGCIRFLQRNRTDIDVDIQKEIYYEGLTQAIMEAEQSHNLLSAGWRLRKSGGVASVQTQRSENQGSQWCKTWPEPEGPRTRSTDVQGQEKMGVSA